MRIMTFLGCILFCMISLQSIAQVDSMEIDGEYYKIYPYPQNVEVHSDYWIAVNDKEYFLDPENYFQLFGESITFSRKAYESAKTYQLELLDKRLKSKWKNMRKKGTRAGLGPRYAKQARKHPEALIAARYSFNKEVLPPFIPIPDGKYVQLFSEFCLADKKGKCQAQTNRVAGYFNVKNNSIDGHAVWVDLKGDTIKEGSFVNGLKEGEWTLRKIDRPYRRLYNFTTRPFRKNGEFNNLDTTFYVADYHQGILHGNYYYKEQDRQENDLVITGHFYKGLESGNWKTYFDTSLVRSVTYADNKNEVLSKNPILRTTEFLSGYGPDINLRGYKHGRLEIPHNFYKIGFVEEPDVELEEEQFKSHELEYYGKYFEDESLPVRFREVPDFYKYYNFYEFERDPKTSYVDTRGHFIDSIGAKMLYNGSYEIFYPNGQLYVNYQFENGELVDEGILYWDNGKPHDVIEFVADSNYYLRKAYDYDGVLYKTAIYDSLGDFLKFDEPVYVEPFLAIDGIEAELKRIPNYSSRNFYPYLKGNFVYYNWDTLTKAAMTGPEMILYKRWSGFDTTVIGEMTYNPETRTMKDYDLSYTGVKRWEAERVFTENFGSWTGKSTWKYGDFTVVTSQSAIVQEFDNDTLPQQHVKYYYQDYDITSDIEIFHKGELYTGKVKIKPSALRFKKPHNKIVLKASYYSSKRKIQRKLYKFFKKGKNKDDDLLSLVSSLDDCGYVSSSLYHNLIGSGDDGYFARVGGNSRGNSFQSRGVYSDVSKIKGEMVEGKAQNTWKGKSGLGRLISEVSFDRGEPIGAHSRYAFRTRATRWSRKMSSDSLPSRKIYFLYQTTEYDKGMLNGPYREYFWYGDIKEKGTFLDGYLEGEFISRFPLAYSKSNYKNGMLDGYVQTFLTLPHRDSILLYDLNFQHGFLNGKSVAYHTNGRLAKQGFFLDGEPIDDYEAYDTLGFRYHYVKFKYSQPVEEKIWEENELSLRYLFNWEDSVDFDPSDITSSMSLESLMYKLGYGTGALQDEYYGRPRLIDKTGLKYHMTKFYPNDTIAREGSIIDGKKIGDWTFFDYEGQFLYEVNYFDSIITVNDSVVFKSKGVLTDYDDSRNKLYDAFIIEKMEKYDCAHTDHYEIRQLYTTWEANDTSGRMNGYVQNFYDNGVLQNEGRMKDGLPDGLWKYYDPFGKLNLMGTFHQGKRNGRWLSGDLEEKKYLGEICLNPNLPDLEEEKKYRENLLDVTITNYKLGKAMNKQFYDLNLNKYSNLKND